MVSFSGWQHLKLSNQGKQAAGIDTNDEGHESNDKNSNVAQSANQKAWVLMLFPEQEQRPNKSTKKRHEDAEQQTICQLSSASGSTWQWPISMLFVCIFSFLVLCLASASCWETALASQPLICTWANIWFLSLDSWPHHLVSIPAACLAAWIILSAVARNYHRYVVKASKKYSSPF